MKEILFIILSLILAWLITSFITDLLFGERKRVKYIPFDKFLEEEVGG